MFGGFDKDSDIDVLLTSYQTILSRDDFFNKFPKILQEIGAVINQEIQQALIPIIKFEFMGKEFDILYCSMKAPNGDSMIKEVEEGRFFENVKFVSDDKANLMSFRGWSNCNVLYSMIKDKEAFSWSLRIIKTWAK